MDIKIKELRKKLDMTLTDFASVLGVSVSAVQRWEAGSRQPGHMAKKQIARLERRANKAKE